MNITIDLTDYFYKQGINCFILWDTEKDAFVIALNLEGNITLETADEFIDTYCFLDMQEFKDVYITNKECHYDYKIGHYIIIGLRY